MKKRIIFSVLLVLLLVVLFGCKNDENLTGNAVNGKSVLSGMGSNKFFTGSLFQKVKDLFKKEDAGKLIVNKDQKIDSLLDPILTKKFLPPQSLKDNKDFKEGFIPKTKLKNYMIAFTNDEKYDDSIKGIIEFQKGLNGLTLNDALVVDEAMANSLKNAIDEVKNSGGNDQVACGNFNALLNPSVLTMDLTLWTGKSKVYNILKQNRDLGIQCEFYFPQLQHGMFAYDLVTGKLVQKNAFCDNSEKKSKCFGVWNYFWKFAMDSKDGSANYGGSCTLVDWMNQGFVCVNGVDLKSDKNGKLIKNYLVLGVEGQLFAYEKDIKDEFVNSLGADGNAVVNNVKNKCSQISQKANMYGYALGGENSITGMVVNTKVSTKTTDKLTQNIQKQSESSMLFASQFTEACLIEIDKYKKDAFGGGKGAGGVGGVLGLNRPSNCLLSQAMQIASSSKAARFQQCVSNFAHQVQGSKMQELTSLDKSPTDMGCGSPSASSGVVCRTIKCIAGDPGGTKDCGTKGDKCGGPPSSTEAGNMGLDKNNKDKDGNNVRVIRSEEELHDTCGAGARACADRGTKTNYIGEREANGNTNLKHDDGTPYTPAEVEAHEAGHQKYDKKAQPGETKEQREKREAENEAAQRKRDEESHNKNKKKTGTPTPDDTGDGCSSQAERWAEQLASCTEDKSAIFDSGGKLVNKPRPDPAPDDVGGSPSPCESAGAVNMFNTKEGAKDECMTGDDPTCDFGGPFYGGSVQQLMNKKCQYAGSSAADIAGEEGGGTGGGSNKGLQCPSSIGGL